MTDILKIKTDDGWKGISVVQGEVTPLQPDWEQSDNSEIDFIKNKPVKLSDFTDDTGTNPVDKADTLTGLSASVAELNYCDGVSSNIQTQLDNKAGLDLADVTDCGTSRAAGWAMPSSVYDDLTVGTSGASYTAPANGYFLAEGTSTGYGWISLDGILKDTAITYASSQGADVYIPCLKNGEITLSWSNMSNITLKFIYAAGSESEAE